MAKQVYAYLRVSGRGQVDGDGFPRQLDAIGKFAASNGLGIEGTFEEKGVKGKTEWGDRPAWVEMLRRIVENGVRTIVIEKLDRLARDLMVQEHIIADLQKRGIELISVHEPDLGTEDPTRILFRHIMGAIAQYDKSMIVMKLRSSRQRARAEKGRCEGRKPYGDLPGEAAVLAEMRNEVDAGETAAGIARLLNERGRLTRSGGNWHPFVVSRILRRAQ